MSIPSAVLAQVDIQVPLVTAHQLLIALQTLAKMALPVMKIQTDTIVYVLLDIPIPPVQPTLTTALPLLVKMEVHALTVLIHTPAPVLLATVALNVKSVNG